MDGWGEGGPALGGGKACAGGGTDTPVQSVSNSAASVSFCTCSLLILRRVPRARAI